MSEILSRPLLLSEADLMGGPDPIPLPEAKPVPVGWAGRSEQIQNHLIALREMVGRKPSPPKESSGRGVVLVGGGAYWPGIVLAVRMLRRFDPEIPIQIWHRGAEEPIDPKQVEGFGPIQIVDAIQWAKECGGLRILRGWETKLFALTRCGFEKVLYLDADAYTVESIAPLFDLLEKSPFVFWQDLPHSAHSVRWPEVWPEGSRDVPWIQGGQLAFDVPRCWEHLVISHWICQHSDFYFTHIFGDQDAYRIAFAAKPISYLNLGMAPWQNTAFVCPTLDGVKRIVHRCQGKLFRQSDIPTGKQNYSSPQYALPREQEVFDLFAQIIAEENPKASAVFGEIYKRKLWGDGSGPGSLPAEAKPFLNLFNHLFKLNPPESVVDLGCGDGAVGEALEVATYTGVDCHLPHIERLSRKHPRRLYLHGDLFADREKLPSGQVAILKDVLHHWPTAWVVEWLTWAIAAKKWKRLYLVQDCHQQTENADCHLGGYRALNFKMAPLKNFPQIRHVIDYLHKSVLVIDL